MKREADFFYSMRLLAVAFLLFSQALLASTGQINKPPQAAIATAHPLATQAGKQILLQGGNAFDAAVAVTTVLSLEVAVLLSKTELSSSLVRSSIIDPSD